MFKSKENIFASIIRNSAKSSSINFKCNYHMISTNRFAFMGTFFFVSLANISLINIIGVNAYTVDNEISVS